MHKNDDGNLRSGDVSLEVLALLAEGALEDEYAEISTEAEHESLVALEKPDAIVDSGYGQLREKAHDPLRDQKEEEERHRNDLWFELLVERVNRHNQEKKNLELRQHTHIRETQSERQRKLELNVALQRALDKGRSGGQRQR